MKKNIAVIGAGAAGFFGAIRMKSLLPEANVIVFEKSNKMLAKVKVSGGGRCNVTHACFEVSKLIKNYPRGSKELRSAFMQFACTDTVNWFNDRGVELKIESDGRMFPVSNNSQTIIDCLMDEAERLGVQFSLGTSIKKVTGKESKIELLFENDSTIEFDAVLIATGGHPNKEGFKWLAATNHSIVEPVPSLFTFNFKDKTISALMGVSVPDAQVKIVGTKLEYSGPLLITHWGISGPAVLKLSSFAARQLAEMKYEFTTSVNWLNRKEEEVRELILQVKKNFPKRTLFRVNEIELPKRLWEYILYKLKIDGEQIIGNLSKDNLNRIVNTLINDQYEVKGKTTFKEEFVTCGGIDLKEVDFKTMESKLVPNLFFAGEVLDVDAITGGFNFQAAWTTGYIAGSEIGKRFSVKH
ncbi:MAG: NAD(P)/FAD-dependent oxidoreductase [Bacteroidetes bacterium]|nr:NAD(P)/FAD-dependent oxidoreductase [Bacteroidota bacterium]